MNAPAKSTGTSRLGSFIREHLDVAERMTPGELRDHCREMLVVVANDMDVEESDRDPREAVELIARGEADEVVLHVGNRDRPFSAHALPCIFEPLVRAASSGALRPDELASIRLGQGLFIVREIVHGHHGTVTAASGRHAGTVFTIRLPRGDAPVDGTATAV